MSKRRLDRSYVSEVDKFLSDFDAEHSIKTPAQQREIDKHARIAKLRDEPDADQAEDIL